jgi:hypothetical protein
MKRELSLSERVFRYVERYALRTGLEQYPTLREVARGLSTGSRKVEEAVEEDRYRMWTESYFTTTPPATDETFVNVDSPKLDALWRRRMGIDAQDGAE